MKHNIHPFTIELFTKKSFYAIIKMYKRYLKNNIIFLSYTIIIGGIKYFFLGIIQLIITEIIHHLDIIPIIPQLVITVFMNQSIAPIFIKIYMIIIRYTNLCIWEMIKLEVHLIITLIINNKLKKQKEEFSLPFQKP